MMTVYVLVTYGGANATEPYVAVFSSLGAAQRAYRRLADNGGEGSRFFIEYHAVDKPASKARQVASGPVRNGS